MQELHKKKKKIEKINNNQRDNYGRKRKLTNT